MPNYLAYSTKNRETGTLVQLFDATHPDKTIVIPDSESGKRWAIFCKEHGTTSFYKKQSDAYSAMTKPSGWCEGCRGEPVTVSSTPAAIAQVKGQKRNLVKENICAWCVKELRNAKDGHWHMRGAPPKHVCCSCADHNEE